MKRFLTADDVVSDIQSELLQAAISRDELAHSIQLVKAHQGKLRDEYFSSRPQMGLRVLVARQFQLYDMLLTLLQEMESCQRETGTELRQLGELAFAGLPRQEAARGQRLLLDMWATSELESLVDRWPPQEIHDAMSPDALMPQMVLQPPRIPLVGGLLNRIRIALHRISIFYVEQLARSQAKVNAVFGSWIEKSVGNAHEQREMLRVLSGKVEALEDALRRGTSQ